MKLSVVIVNYNVEYFLDQCLSSVKIALENIDGEIIVVDNNSIDGSNNMVKNKYPEVTADNIDEINEELKKKTIAIVYGVKISAYDWINSGVDFTKISSMNLNHTKGYLIEIVMGKYVPEDKVNQNIRGFIEECLKVKLAAIESKDVFASIAGIPASIGL